MHQFLLSSLLALLFIQLVSSKLQQDRPDQLIEVFRHGARGPLSNYDPTWPVAQEGILTPPGMRQHYVLGQTLKQKYPEFFSTPYNLSTAYLISDVDDRCIQSAHSHLQGIFEGMGPSLPEDYPADMAVPPYQDTEIDAIADSLNDSYALPHNYQPYVINIVDKENGGLFDGMVAPYCPNANVWQNSNLNDTKVQEKWQLFNETVALINQYMPDSSKIVDPFDLIMFGDAILCDITDNRTLIGGVNNNQQLLTNVSYAFSLFYYLVWWGQDAQKQTYAYELIIDLIGQLQSFRSGENYNVTAFYSCHDTNIQAIFVAFNLVNETCLTANYKNQLNNEPLTYPFCYYPPFASDFIIEFYNKTANPYVRLFYNNVEMFLCQPNEPCSLDDFVTFAYNSVGNITQAQKNEICGMTTVQLASKEKVAAVPAVDKSGGTGGVFMKVLLIFMGVFCAFLYAKNVSDQRKYNNALKRNEGLLTGSLKE